MHLLLAHLSPQHAKAAYLMHTSFNETHGMCRTKLPQQKVLPQRQEEGAIHPSLGESLVGEGRIPQAQESSHPDASCREVPHVQCLIRQGEDGMPACPAAGQELVGKKAVWPGYQCVI